MTDEIQRRKKFIKDRVGKETLDILKEAGLNVDDAMDKIIGNRIAKEKETKSQTDIPRIDNFMTSELVYWSKNPEDIYGKEYARRLDSIGFNQEKISGLYVNDQKILSSKEDKQRKSSWAQRYYLIDSITPETLPESKEMALSELIVITDDANAAFFRDHEWLPEKAWKALCIASIQAEYCEGRYNTELVQRTVKKDWSNEQVNAYARNECLLIERLKWGMHKNPAWTKETTDLSRYRKNQL